MPGSVAGGRKAAKTNKRLYGDDFFVMIGTAGGKASKGGGFKSDKIGKDGLTGRERAAIAGRKGGLKSRRPVNANRMV